MLKIFIPEKEYWDEINNEFITKKSQTLQLEHSLVSLSKWESKWHKPFLVKDPKTVDEIKDYIRCMTLTQNVDPEIYDRLPNSVYDQVNNYIEDSMTATWFTDNGKKAKKSSEQVTAEIIYYWMISLNIPFECQKWHLNRLLTLVEVCNRKNEPPKKMSKREALSQQAALNAARKKKLKTKG